MDTSRWPGLDHFRELGRRCAAGRRREPPDRWGAGGLGKRFSPAARVLPMVGVAVGEGRTSRDPQRRAAVRQVQRCRSPAGAGDDAIAEPGSRRLLPVRDTASTMDCHVGLRAGGGELVDIESLLRALYAAFCISVADHSRTGSTSRWTSVFMMPTPARWMCLGRRTATRRALCVARRRALSPCGHRHATRHFTGRCPRVIRSRVIP